MVGMLGSVRTGTKLSIGFSSLIAFLVVIGVFGMYSAGRLGNLLHSMYAERVSGILLVSEAHIEAAFHYKTLYELASETDKMVIEDIEKDLKGREGQMRKLLGEYRRNAIGEREQELLKRFDGVWPTYVELVAKVGDLARRGDSAAALMLIYAEAQVHFSPCDQVLKEIVALNREQAKVADDDGAALSARIHGVSLGMILFAAAFGALIAVAVTRSITGPLGRAVVELRRIAAGDMTANIEVHGKDEAAKMFTSLREMQGGLCDMVGRLQDTAIRLEGLVGEVTDASHDLTRRAQDSHGAVRDAASAMERLSGGIDAVGESANEAGRRAAAAGDAARDGAAVGEGAAADVTAANERIAQTADTIRRLSEQVQQVGVIVDVIVEIAEQTNLLALNAAIEAARAGEQGRGFAVVADEVRKLAERTTASANDIRSRIEAIQGGTREVVASMTQSSEAMAAVRAKVADTNGALKDIGGGTGVAVAAMHEIARVLGDQRAASGGIASNIQSVAKMSEANADTAGRVNQSILGVRTVAEELVGIVRHFKVRS